MKNQAKTIDEVLEQLDAVIAVSKENNDPLGCFAYIYRRTTAQIKLAILEGKFEDNARMEKFDVLFANKYLDAYRDFHNGKAVCSPWTAAFDVKKDKLTILQHIILGMNTHINYDLGLSATEFMAGGKIEELEKDFMLVNDILASLVDELQVKVSKVSRLMFLLDWIGERNDEVVINFSMEKARKQAWNFALAMSVIEGPAREAMIIEAENLVTILGNKLKNPPGKLLPFVINIISRFETKDVKKIIARLEAD
jgi:hypothetical protein